MAWRTNEEIPLDAGTQSEMAVLLAKAAGLDPEKPGESGEKLGYMMKERLADAAAGRRIGTLCGAKGNVFSKEMAKLLEKAEHVGGCWMKSGERTLVAAMLVKGFTAAQGVELARLAVEAGCSLRPDVANVAGEQWILFESGRISDVLGR